MCVCTSANASGSIRETFGQCVNIIIKRCPVDCPVIYESDEAEEVEEEKGRRAYCRKREKIKTSRRRDDLQEEKKHGHGPVVVVVVR